EAGEIAVAHLPGDVSARWLDLGYLGAEIREQHRRVGARQHVADLEDPDAGQRRCGHLRTSGTTFTGSPRPGWRAGSASGAWRPPVRPGRGRSAAAGPTDR